MEEGKKKEIALSFRELKAYVCSESWEGLAKVCGEVSVQK